MRMAPETVKHNHHPMATVSESPEDSPNPNSPAPTPLPPPSDYPSKSESKVLEQATPWIDYAVEQALLYQKIIEQNINATIEASRSRLSEFGSTSAAHFNQTIVRFSKSFILFIFKLRIRRNGSLCDFFVIDRIHLRMSSPSLLFTRT